MTAMQLSLEIKAKQQLSISPQLQQAIRLLQLSSLELHQEIQQTIERNPLLEMDDIEQTEITEHLPNANIITTTSSKSISISEEMAEDPYFNTKNFEKLSDHLLTQLNLLTLNDDDYTIALMIIDAINPDGYLKQSITEISESLSTDQNIVDEEDVNAVLGCIQNFDPPGIGARSVAECITLQLKKLDLTKKPIKDALLIIDQYFDWFSKKEYKKICRETGLTPEEFTAAQTIIKNTNPRPGANFSQLNHHYIIPDVFVRKHNHTWQVYLNPHNNPTPRINKNVLAMLGHANTKNDRKYIKENLKEAKWFISSIENRNSTLLKVAKAIMDYQMDFLLSGEMAMKPLRLLTIAETVEMHESTISRVTTQKFIDTPHGIFELKHFFSSQLQADNGTACSSTAIKVLIKKMVDNEKKTKPLSDNMIAKLLKNEGINIARRTVTKYREAMGILSSTERKNAGFQL